MLSNAELGKEFWADDINLGFYLMNRSPNPALELKTPKKIWLDIPTDYKHLKVFSCSAYAHIKQGKLEPSVIKCIFLGYTFSVLKDTNYGTQKPRKLLLLEMLRLTNLQCRFQGRTCPNYKYRKAGCSKEGE